MNRASRVVLMGSAILLAVSFSLAQRPHSAHASRTIITHRTSFAADGQVKKTEVQTKSWRSDGSVATESVISVPSSNTVSFRQHVVDRTSGFDTLIFPEMGLKLVRRIPDSTPHPGNPTYGECLSQVETFGNPVGGDPMVRTRPLSNDGSTLVQKFDPSLGCQAVESTHRDSQGRVRTIVQILKASPEVDSAAFHVDPSLQAATRMEIREAHINRFGVPFLGLPDEKIRDLDRRSPPVVDN